MLLSWEERPEVNLWILHAHIRTCTSQCTIHTIYTYINTHENMHYIYIYTCTQYIQTHAHNTYIHMHNMHAHTIIHMHTHRHMHTQAWACTHTPLKMVWKANWPGILFWASRWFCVRLFEDPLAISGSPWFFVFYFFFPWRSLVLMAVILLDLVGCLYCCLFLNFFYY